MKAKSINVITNASIIGVVDSSVIGGNFVGALLTEDGHRIPFHEAILCTQVWVEVIFLPILIINIIYDCY